MSTGKRPVVVIVDDDEDNRDMYSAAFEQAGFDVLTAEDGLTGLAAIDRERPEVVIMDLMMPEFDGWEATRRLRAKPENAETLVVVVTGAVVDEYVKAAYDAGADDVCSKPCLPTDLVKRVQKLLRARKSKRT